MHGFRSWRLNIFSMRSVIMNPPTTLIVAAVTAMKPSTVLAVPWSAAGGHQRADQRNARDGVGGRHQRRVQQGRHLGDHLVADEAGQHEHVELQKWNQEARLNHFRGGQNERLRPKPSNARALD